MKRLLAAALVLVGCALGFLWWQAADRAARAGTLGTIVDDLQAAIPRLTEEMLKLRTSLSRNQDGVVRELRRSTSLLEKAAAQIGDDRELTAKVDAVSGLLKDKEDLVDRLRSELSLLQNSLDSLIDLDRGAVRPDGLHDLVLSALLYERNGDAATGENVRTALDRLKVAGKTLLGESKEDLRYADAHARRVLELAPKVEKDLYRMVARSHELPLDGLSAAVAARHDEASRRALVYRDALFVYIALFLLGIAALQHRAHRRAADLNRANEDLERAVDQRTRQLADHEAETRAILDGSAEGILSVEEHGTIRACNPAVELLFGYRKGELTGKPVELLIPGSWAAIRLAGPRRRADTGLRRNGRTFPLEVLANEVRLGGHRIYSLILRDVTELRRIEEMKNEFISTVSHELRTPLTSIRGALGLVSSGVLGPLSPKAKPMVDIAAKNCERLVNLVSDILDIEKLASGKLTFKMRTLSLSELLKGSADANRGYADTLGVGLEVEVPPGDSLVLADSDRLTQVLTNLVSNACKFSPKGAKVTIRLTRREGKVRVGVRDRGDGIPEDFRARIFQKFAQADTADASQRKGTGLGLAISKALIERMGGTIGFETETGKGTTFFIELTEERAAAPISPETGRPRLLVCEDERDIAEVLRAMLDREGYDCDLAPTLKDARALLARRRYAAMTLDLSLPDGSGIGLLHEIRQNPATHELPVIVISANLDQNRRALNGNVFDLVDWLEKPIPAERLEQVLRRSCAANAAKRPRVLHVEDDPDIANIVAGVLSRTADVVTATTVLSAWELLKTEDFDLLILDIGLPDGSGLELLPALRKATGTPIPSLVFSAHEISPRLANTVTAALLKSKTSNEQLVQRVRQLLQRPADPAKPEAAKV